MGLDITAHRGLVPAPEAAMMDEDARYRTDVHQFYHNPDFPGRADDIAHKGFYRAAESFSFRAGSYSGYNRWRDQLAELAEYSAVPHPRRGDDSHAASVWADPKPGPFMELSIKFPPWGQKGVPSRSGLEPRCPDHTHRAVRANPATRLARS